MSSPPTVKGDEAIEQALAALAQGQLVGMPTETVYGLAADAARPDAVAKIFANRTMLRLAGRFQNTAINIEQPAVRTN